MSNNVKPFGLTEVTTETQFKGSEYRAANGDKYRVVQAKGAITGGAGTAVSFYSGNQNDVVLCTGTEAEIAGLIASGNAESTGIVTSECFWIQWAGVGPLAKPITTSATHNDLAGVNSIGQFVQLQATGSELGNPLGHVMNTTATGVSYVSIKLRGLD